LQVQEIANSRYKNDTLIFVIEDDSQDGGDHMDAHGSIALVAGPYVKQEAVVSAPCNKIRVPLLCQELARVLSRLSGSWCNTRGHPLRQSQGPYFTTTYD
jgi:hypothetical protein